ILNGVALLKREQAGGAGSPVLQMLEEEAHHLDFMVTDLLDYTRSMEPRFRPVVLGEVARRTAQLLESRGELGKVRLAVGEEGAPVTVPADPDLLQLALLNLVRNAVQASPPAGTVHISAEAGPDGGRLVVEDEGRGIPAADAGKIFEPFFTTRARGSGLGLAVVTRVARAHHGEVRVGRSAAGGARFELAIGLPGPRPAG
ncbi:MAG: sensor histidine kinase, partial [Myxococcaceae bacterium]